VRSGHAPGQAPACGLGGQGLDVARVRVVGFVAVHIDQQAALGGDLAQAGDRGATFGHGPFEMRDAADDLDAAIERAQQVLFGVRRAVEAILRESDQLQIQIGRDPAFDFEQGIDREQALVADIDVAADREQAARHRQIAVGERARDQCIRVQLRFQLAPQRDAFEQGAGLIEPRLAQGQRRVQVKMGIHERRRDQTPAGVDLFGRDRVETGRQRGDPSRLDADVDAPPAIGQIGVAYDQVHASVPGRRVGQCNAGGCARSR